MVTVFTYLDIRCAVSKTSVASTGMHMRLDVLFNILLLLYLFHFSLQTVDIGLNGVGFVATSAFFFCTVLAIASALVLNAHFFFEKALCYLCAIHHLKNMVQRMILIGEIAGMVVSCHFVMTSLIFFVSLLYHTKCCLSTEKEAKR
jgi:hypothetical protein